MQAGNAAAPRFRANNRIVHRFTQIFELAFERAHRDRKLSNKTKRIR
jgi:hypothetical protein